MADEKLYDAYGIEVDKHGHRKRKPLSQKDIVFENGQPRVIKHRNLTEEQREAKRERLKKVREMTMQREDNPYFKPKGDKYSDECRSKAEMRYKTNMAKRTTMQEGLKTLLAMNLGKGELIDPENVNDYLALEGQNVNVQNAILISQLNNALAGDSKAFKVLTDILGETTQKVEVDLKSENKSKLDSLIAQIDNHNTFDEEDLDAMKDYEDGTNLPQEE